jgi:hypothetical protein
VNRREAGLVGYCGFQLVDDPWAQPLRICSPDSKTKDACARKTLLVVDTVCSWKYGQCNLKANNSDEVNMCTRKTNEGECLSQSALTIASCEWHEPPYIGVQPTAAPSVFPKTYKKYCGFQGDKNYTVEPFRRCSTIAKTVTDCESKSVLETVGCFWQAGICQPTKVGFEGYCTFKSSLVACYSTPALAVTTSCAWYEVEVKSVAFCGFPYDEQPWTYPPALCSFKAKNSMECEKTGFLSAAIFCTWDKDRCASDPSNSRYAPACSSIISIENCYGYRGGYGNGYCKWFEPPTMHPTDSPVLLTIPSEVPSITPPLSLNPTSTSPPSLNPSVLPTSSPMPSAIPSSARTNRPSHDPTNRPTSTPRNPKPTRNPTPSPTPKPTRLPTIVPTSYPSVSPTAHPTESPTRRPVDQPKATIQSNSPTMVPTGSPTDVPSRVPTKAPTLLPSLRPSESPTPVPSKPPSNPPSAKPSAFPTDRPSNRPTMSPTSLPSFVPYEPEAETDKGGSSTWKIAAFGVAGAAVGGAGCCGACFWLSKRKTDSPDGKNAGNSIVTTIGQEQAPRSTTVIAFGNVDTSLDQGNSGKHEILGSLSNECNDDLDNINDDGASGIDVSSMKSAPLCKEPSKRRVNGVILTNSPPGWFLERILRYLSWKSEPTLPAFTLKTNDGNKKPVKKSIVIVGSPSGWIWERVFRVLLSCCKSGPGTN